MEVTRGYETLLDMFLQRVRETPEMEATRHYKGRNVVITTWKEWHRRSRTLAVGLVGLGLQVGDRVAILCRTRVEWAWMDMAVLMAGGISVPVFPNATAADCAELLEDSGACLVIAEDPMQVAKLVQICEQAPTVSRVIYLDAEHTSPGGDVVGIDDVVDASRAHWVVGLAQLYDLGEERLASSADLLEARRTELQRDTCAVISYTPGTEGRPKGALQTHGNFVATSSALCEALEIGSDDLQLLYLPLAQVFARISLVVAIEAGCCTFFARSSRTVLDDARVCKPAFLCGVPRLFEKTKQQFERELADGGVLSNKVNEWLRDIVADTSEQEAEEGILHGIKRSIAEKWVWKGMRERMGGQLRFLISGGAPLSVGVAHFFRAHGIRVLEGYGMTETCAATHINRYDAWKIGSVGQALNGVEVAFEDDGELLVRGPNITSGYWNRPRETAAALDSEGWLHTGDLASMDADGFLTITGRKRDVIVSAYGKAIAPSRIASALCSGGLVKQALIHGDKRPFLSALLALDANELNRLCEQHHIDGSDEERIRHPRIYGAVEEIVTRVNNGLPSHENIRKFAILSGETSTESGDLTVMQTVRRDALSEKYAALLDSFYSEDY